MKIKKNADTLLDIVEYHELTQVAIANKMEASVIWLRKRLNGDQVWLLDELKQTIQAIESLSKTKINENELYEVKHRKFIV